MKRRAASAGGVPQRRLPRELLEVPLPLSEVDRRRVDEACEAAGWGWMAYLAARIQRKRELLAGLSRSAGERQVPMTGARNDEREDVIRRGR